MSSTNPWKHLVLSGSGLFVIQQLGALEICSPHLQSIETVYATSGGALASFCWMLFHHDWSILRDYVWHRPWHELISWNSPVTIDVFRKIIAPLLISLDLSESFTLQEFFDHTHIEWNVFTVDINTFTTHQLSYRTHPTLSVLEALYRTCSVPIIFAPIMENNACWVDGGLLNNYPLHICLEQTLAPLHTVLGIHCTMQPLTMQDPNDMLHVFHVVLANAFHYLNKQTLTIPHELLLDRALCPQTTVDLLHQASAREAVYRCGSQTAAAFLQTTFCKN